MNRLFGTEALTAAAWLYCLAVGLTIFVLVEIEKLAVHRRLPGRAVRKNGRDDEKDAKGDVSKGRDAK